MLLVSKFIGIPIATMLSVTFFIASCKLFCCWHSCRPPENNYMTDDRSYLIYCIGMDKRNSSKLIRNVHFNVSKDKYPEQKINLTNWSFTDAVTLLEADSDTICEGNYSKVNMEGDDSNIIVFNQTWDRNMG